jgi:hypothetical protein
LRQRVQQGRGVRRVRVAQHLGHRLEELLRRAVGQEVRQRGWVEEARADAAVCRGYCKKKGMKNAKLGQCGKWRAPRRYSNTAVVTVYTRTCK